MGGMYVKSRKSQHWLVFSDVPMVKSLVVLQPFVSSIIVVVQCT